MTFREVTLEHERYWEVEELPGKTKSPTDPEQLPSKVQECFFVDILIFDNFLGVSKTT